MVDFWKRLCEAAYEMYTKDLFREIVDVKAETLEQKFVWECIGSGLCDQMCYQHKSGNYEFLFEDIMISDLQRMFPEEYATLILLYKI